MKIIECCIFILLLISSIVLIIKTIRDIKNERKLKLKFEEKKTELMDLEEELIGYENPKNSNYYDSISEKATELLSIYRELKKIQSGDSELYQLEKFTHYLDEDMQIEFILEKNKPMNILFWSLVYKYLYFKYKYLTKTINKLYKKLPF